jgi:tetratricopeptide (TPR) repeat protein
MDDLEAATDLGPENEEHLARLRRVLTLGAGFQLILLEVSQSSLTEEVLRRLHGWSGKDGVPALAIVRTRPGRDPVAPLRQIATGAILVGLDQPFEIEGVVRELAIVDDGGPQAPVEPSAQDPVEYSLTTLNWFRDELPSLIKGPLILLLSPDGLRRLFVHAPDLLSWRTHTTRLTAPRPPRDLQIRPRPSRRASLEEKAWLEEMIASSSSSPSGLVTRDLPGWLIRLGEIEVREGGPAEERFARAQQLAEGRSDLLFKLALARARHALHEGRDVDVEIHLHEAARHIATNSGAQNRDPESVLESLGWGAAHRELWVRVASAELALVVAEWLLHAGDVEGATTTARFALLGAHAHGDRALTISALSVAGLIARHRGDRANASILFSDMQKVAHEAGDRAAEGFALTRLAELTSEAADAKRLYIEALSILEHDAHDARARAYVGLAQCARRLGSPAEATRILSPIPIGELEPMTRQLVLLARGKAAMAQHHYDDALAAFRSIWDESQHARSSPLTQAFIGLYLGQAALHAGNAEAARDTYQRVAEIAKDLADEQLAAAACEGLARAGIDTEGTRGPA